MTQGPKRLEKVPKARAGVAVMQSEPKQGEKGVHLWRFPECSLSQLEGRGRKASTQR